MTNFHVPVGRKVGISLFRSSLLIMVALAVLMWPGVSLASDGSASAAFTSPTIFDADAQGVPMNLTVTTWTVMTNGRVLLTLPTGWTFAGPPTASVGAVTFDEHSVTISSVSLSSSGTFTISSSVNVGGVLQGRALGVSHAATESGTLTELDTFNKPWVSVYGASGSGTLTVGPGPFRIYQTVAAQFTYTAGTEMNLGAISFTLPAGWSLTGASISNAGTLSIDGQTVTVNDMHLGAGWTQVVSGQLTTDGTGGLVSFPATQKTLSAHTALALAVAPAVTVLEDITDLDYLSIGGGPVYPAFDPAVTTYYMGVHSSYTEVNVNAVRKYDADTTFTIGGVQPPSGYNSVAIPLTGDITPVDVVITPNLDPEVLGLSSKTYSVSLRRLGLDGSGSVSVSPGAVAPGQTGVGLTFTYTASSNMVNGTLLFTIPDGWVAPTVELGQPGLVTASVGQVAVSGMGLTVTGLVLTQGDQVTVVYENTTAPSALDTHTFAVFQASGEWSRVAALTVSATVGVVGDGSGRVESVSELDTDTTNAPFSFTYVATNNMANGSVAFTLPAGLTWVGTPTATTHSVAHGTVTSLNGVVTVTGFNLQAEQGLVIAGFVDVGSIVGTLAMEVQQASLASGTLTTISAVDVALINVYGPFGSGTMTVNRTVFSRTAESEQWESLTFTYTAESAMVDGRITLLIPDGWTYAIARIDSNYAAITGRTATFSNLHLQAGDTVNLSVSIIYGDQGVTGPFTLDVHQSANSTGPLKPLVQSPQITLYAPVGSGTAAFVNAGRNSGDTNFTLLYTAAAGGMLNGFLQLEIPAGWVLHGTPVASTGNTPVVFGNPTNVNVGNITLAANESMTITLWMTPPSPGEPNAWTIWQRSINSGQMANMQGQPSITLYQSGQQGTVTFSPAIAGFNQTHPISFTYTANYDMYLGRLLINNVSMWTLTDDLTTTAGVIARANGTSGLTVTDLTLLAGESVTFGATATASSTGQMTMTVKQGPDPIGYQLFDLATTVTSTVHSPDGSGGASLIQSDRWLYAGVETTVTVHYSAGYMATMYEGAVRLTLPTGWTLLGTPKSTHGNVTVDGNSFTVDTLTLGVHEQMRLTVPVMIPATPGVTEFTLSQKSLSNGTMLPIAPLGVTTVIDGVGTLTLPATSVTAGQSGVNLALTYTTGGPNFDGQLVVQLPTGWIVTGTPTITSEYEAHDWLTDYLTVAGNTLTIDEVWMGSGESFTLTVVATVGQTTGTAQFTAGQKTLRGGTLTNLATSPTATVLAPPPPPPLPLATIAVSGPSQVVAGGSASFSANGSNSAGGPVALNTVTWTASQGSIAGGSWTAPTLAGTYTITAAQSGVSGSATITVVAGPVASVTVTPGSGTVLTNDTLSFSASAKDVYGNAISAPTFTWSASGGAASAGLFTASQIVGSASITASSGGVSDSATITIGARPIVGPTPVPVTTTEQADGTKTSEANVDATSVRLGSDLVINLISPVGSSTSPVGQVAADLSIGALDKLQAQGSSAVIQTGSVTMSVPPRAFAGLVGAPTNEGGSVGVRISVQSVDPNAAVTPDSSPFVVATQQSINRAKSTGLLPVGQVLDLTAEVTQRDASGAVTGTTKITQFATPLQIEIPYTNVGNPSLLGVYRLNPATGIWEFRGGIVDRVRQVVIIQLTGFSQYALMEYTKVFTDVPTTHWAQADIQVLAARQIVYGISETEFSPAGTVTRAQFAALLVRTLNLPAAATTTFTDVTSTDWFHADVASAAQAGLIVGSNNQFRPNDSISRQEMAVMLDRVLTLRGKVASVSPGEASLIINAYADNSKMGDWAKESIAHVFRAGLMSGRIPGVFDPQATSTRAEAITVIKRALEWMGDL